MPASTDSDDYEWTERVCVWASASGIRVKEVASSAGVAFNWLLPRGGVVHSIGHRDRGIALMRACWDLSRHLNLNFADQCPRMFL